MTPELPQDQIPEKVRALYREWGRQGGQMGNRKGKARGGQIATMKRMAREPRCPQCLRPLHDTKIKGRPVYLYPPTEQHPGGSLHYDPMP